MSGENGPTIDEKTIMECVREDMQQMEQVQKVLDLLVGHQLMATSATIHYRGCEFIIKRAE